MALHLLKCKVTNASVDWLSVTASTKEKREALWAVGERLLQRGESEGEHTPRWHAHGYSGWCGEHIALGVRKDGVHLRLSSLKSAHYWRHALAASENCSRLDLAVDCELERPVTALSRQIYRDASHIRPETGRPPKRSLIVSGDGGSTVYIGSRASESMGRVYDKGIESKTRPGGTWWRWEVEYKGDRSFAMGSALQGIDEPAVFICATVASWFRSRSSHTFTRSAIPPIYNGNRAPTGADQQLSWLARGVRPTVASLIERVGLERVLSALGLPPQSVVPQPQPVRGVRSA
jgi:hypothetical protein